MGPKLGGDTVMAIMEKLTFQIPYDKRDEFWELECKIDEIEMGRYSAPPKRRYQPQFGGGHWDMCIIEREWESASALEAHMAKFFSDPEVRALLPSPSPIYANGTQETYTILEPPADGTS